jgi:hypothetical protein
MNLFARYKLSQQKEDLDKSILHCNEAILLQPVFRVHDEPHRKKLRDHFFGLLFSLAVVLIELSEKCGQSDGVQFSTEYLRYLQGLHLDEDSFDAFRNLVTTFLIKALPIQVLLEAGDRAQNTKEMVDLGRELLTSNISADFQVPVETFMILNKAVNAEYVRGCVQSLDPAIECLRDAVKVFQSPLDSYIILWSLADILIIRFMVAGSKDDDKEATALLGRILDPNQA